MRTIILSIFTLLLAATMSVLVPDAHAGLIESPERTVNKVRVVYVEPVPTPRLPHRTYFETNDGATYRFVNFRVCRASGLVAPNTCREAFFYAA